jgi:hypothetical protein
LREHGTDRDSSFDSLIGPDTRNPMAPESDKIEAEIKSVEHKMSLVFSSLTCLSKVTKQERLESQLTEACSSIKETLKKIKKSQTEKSKTLSTKINTFELKRKSEFMSKIESDKIISDLQNQNATFKT